MAVVEEVAWAPAASAGTAAADAEEGAVKETEEEKLAGPFEDVVDDDQVPDLVSNLRPWAVLSRSLAFSSLAW